MKVMANVGKKLDEVVVVIAAGTDVQVPKGQKLELGTVVAEEGSWMTISGMIFVFNYYFPFSTIISLFNYYFPFQLVSKDSDFFISVFLFLLCVCVCVCVFGAHPCHELTQMVHLSQSTRISWIVVYKAVEPLRLRKKTTMSLVTIGNQV